MLQHRTQSASSRDESTRQDFPASERAARAGSLGNRPRARKTSHGVGIPRAAAQGMHVSGPRPTVPAHPVTWVSLVQSTLRSGLMVTQERSAPGREREKRKSKSQDRNKVEDRGLGASLTTYVKYKAGENAQAETGCAVRGSVCCLVRWRRLPARGSRIVDESGL
jgi:hypothetical protein